jgi:hypothetical protein
MPTTTTRAQYHSGWLGIEAVKREYIIEGRGVESFLGAACLIAFTPCPPST